MSAIKKFDNIEDLENFKKRFINSECRLSGNVVKGIIYVDEFGNKIDKK